MEWYQFAFTFQDAMIYYYVHSKNLKEFAIFHLFLLKYEFLQFPLELP